MAIDIDDLPDPPAERKPQSISIDDLPDPPSSGIDIDDLPDGPVVSTPGEMLSAPIEAISSAVAPVTGPVAELAKKGASKIAKIAAEAPPLRAAKLVAELVGEKESAEDLLKNFTSNPVGKAIEALNIPMNFVAGRALPAIDMFSPGIKKKLNPEGKWVPDIVWHDVINHLTPTPEEMVKKFGQGRVSDDMMKNAYWSLRTGLGLAADVAGDPLFAGKLKVLQATKEALAAQKTGAYLDPVTKQKNLITLGVPFKRDPLIEVRGEKIQKAVTKIGGEIRARSPEMVRRVADGVAETLNSFNPFTGNDYIDMSRAGHWAAVSADRQTMINFLAKGKKYGFNDAENKLLSSVIESTPNLKAETLSSLPYSVEASKKVGEGIEILAPKIDLAIKKNAERLGVKLTPSRLEDLQKAALEVKEMNARSVERLVLSKGDELENLDELLITDYLAHQISPEARAYIKKNPNLAAAIEGVGLEKSIIEALGGNTVSSYNPTKFARKHRTNLEEANALMKEKTGLDKFFIEDPFIGTAVKTSRAFKFYRDKELLESVSRFGVRPRDAIQKAKLSQQGFKPIEHRDFKGKTIVIKGEDGKTITTQLQDLMFPKEIADKMSYDFMIKGAKNIGNVNAFMDWYNTIFRSTALFKPDYHMENWIENILKNYANDVRLDSYADAAKVIAGKPGSEIVFRDGTKMTVERFKREILDKYTVVNAGAFGENMEQILFTGKKIAFEKNLGKDFIELAGKGKEWTGKAIGLMSKIGAKGENYTRLAFFIDKIKDGYTPASAALEVEKFLFNFHRTTKNMDTMRRYYNPFIQAAMKTVVAGPKLIAKKPWLYNAYENNLADVLQDSFHDPVGAWAIKEIMPGYDQFRDRIAGPLIPGSHWIFMGANEGKPEGSMGYVVNLGIPGGMADLVGQFAIWEPQVYRNARSAPLIRSLIIGLSGKDPFTGKEVTAEGSPNQMAAQINAAVANFISSPVAFPGVKKYFSQKLGMVDPQYIEPGSVIALQSNMGKFGKVTNLDKEFLFKIMALSKIEGELNKQLSSVVLKESMGKTADVSLYDWPAARRVVNYFSRPESSAEVFDAYMKNAELVVRGTKASGVVSLMKQGQTPDSHEVLGFLANIRSTIKQVNKAYQVNSEHRFQMASQLLKEGEINDESELDEYLNNANDNLEEETDLEGE